MAADTGSAVTSGCRGISSVASPGLGAGTAGGGSVGVSFGGVGSKAVGNSGLVVGGSLPLLALGTRRGRAAGRLAGGEDAWALSSAARMRCRSDSDSTGLVNGPVPGLLFVPGTRRGRRGPPLSSATPTPWLRVRRRDRFKTEQHKTVCHSTQTGQLMTNKTCR